VLLLSAIEVILRAPGPSRAHCCLLQTRHSGRLCPLARLHLNPDNHANIPPLSFFTGWMPFLPPNQQRQSTEGSSKHWRQSWRFFTYFLATTDITAMAVIMPVYLSKYQTQFAQMPIPIGASLHNLIYMKKIQIKLPKSPSTAHSKWKL